MRTYRAKLKEVRNSQDEFHDLIGQEGDLHLGDSMEQSCFSAGGQLVSFVVQEMNPSGRTYWIRSKRGNLFKFTIIPREELNRRAAELRAQAACLQEYDNY